MIASAARLVRQNAETLLCHRRGRSYLQVMKLEYRPQGCKPITGEYDAMELCKAAQAVWQHLEIIVLEIQYLSLGANLNDNVGQDLRSHCEDQSCVQCSLRPHRVLNRVPSQLQIPVVKPFTRERIRTPQ